MRPAPGHKLPAYVYDPALQVAVDEDGLPVACKEGHGMDLGRVTHTDGDGGDKRDETRCDATNLLCRVSAPLGCGAVGIIRRSPRQPAGRQLPISPIFVGFTLCPFGLVPQLSASKCAFVYLIGAVGEPQGADAAASGKS